MTRKSITAVMLGAVSLAVLSGPAFAQSQDEVLRRLEAKIDSLAKENASLRERVKRIEAPRATPAAAPRAASNAQPATANAALSANAADVSANVAGGRPRGACAQFAGWYVGANAGWATLNSTWVDRDNWIDNFAIDFNSSAPSTSRGGVTGGVDLGYNWQMGCAVFGLQVEGNLAGISGSKSYSPSAPPTTTLTLDDRLNWHGNIRTRTGVVVDNLLIYATGGIAYAGIKHHWTVNDPFIPDESFSAGQGRWGGVVGVGTEWALNDRWSVWSEFLYTQFKEKKTSAFSTAGNQTVTFDSQDSMWTSRIGINYKFGY